MGVQGLFSLLENHSQVYRETKLRGRKLLIDGCNLIHLLYFTGLDQNLGGEYAAFEDLIERFVSALKICNISPFVILDGGSDISGKKDQTCTLRAENRIKRSHLAATGGGQKNILPPLATKVFTQTLMRLNVPLVQCYGEADQEVAALAAEWNCPVLSDDSDFFIFELPSGLLPIRHFLWWEASASQRFIRCRAYRASSFCIYFQIPCPLLPVFAILAGNDYSKLQVASWTQDWLSRLEGLLRWLKDFQQPEEALRAALRSGHVQSERQEAELMELLSAFIKTYELPASSTKDLFVSGQKAPPPEQGADLIPEWTWLPLMHCQLPPSILDILLLHKMKLSIMVDDGTLPSANGASRPLRQLFYGLLLGGDAVPPVEERDRDGLKLSFTQIKPTVTCTAQKLRLGSLQQSKASERLQVLLEALGVTEEPLNKLPSQLRLPVAVTRYWMQRAEPRPDNQLLRALLQGMMWGHKAGPGRRPEPGLKVKGQRKLTPDVGVVHSLCQWQACLTDALQLNQLLCFPLEEPDIARLYQGTFIHHLLHHNSFLHSDAQLYDLLLSITQQTSAPAAPAAPAGPGEPRRSPRIIQQQMLKLEEEEQEDECSAQAEQVLLMEKQLVVKNRQKSKKKAGLHRSALSEYGH
ncbi:single-strand DNA endonuclease ASTE1 isoform X2 [Gouania willdenowi]|uniref:single-strand DNA endonuclease ASTE1 isoform X2 n=1 Tax=Gouania willdenowi TaxID=441366 RepID=UPI00105500C6|nr:protein asteroid homolog 1-like isoform X2 [Gouania willdenowi]